MKKIIPVFFVVLSLFFSGCSTSTKTTASGTEIQNATIEERTILDQNGITIIVTGTEITSSNDYKILLTVENNSSYTIGLTSLRAVLNGIDLDTGYDHAYIGNNDGLAPGETTTDAYFYIENKAFELLDIDTVEEIDLILRIANQNDSSNPVLQSDLITLKTSAYENGTYDYDGYEILNQSNIKITAGPYTTYSNNDELTDCALFFIENNTDETLEISTSDLTVNDTFLEANPVSRYLLPDSTFLLVLQGVSSSGDTYGLINLANTDSLEKLSAEITISNDDASISKQFYLSYDENGSAQRYQASTEGQPSIIEQTVYDQDDVIVTALEVTVPLYSESPDYMQSEIRLHVENNSDQDMGFFVNSVNGIGSNYYSDIDIYTEDGYSYYGRYIIVDANTSEDIYVSVGRDFLQILGIDTFSSMECSIYYGYEDGTYTTYYEEHTFTIQFTGEDGTNYSGKEILNEDGISIYFIDKMISSDGDVYLAFVIQNDTDSYVAFDVEEIKLDSESFESDYSLSIDCDANSSTVEKLYFVLYDDDTETYEYPDFTDITFTLNDSYFSNISTSVSLHCE